MKRDEIGCLQAWFSDRAKAVIKLDSQKDNLSN